MYGSWFHLSLKSSLAFISLWSTRAQSLEYERWETAARWGLKTEYWTMVEWQIENRRLRSILSVRWHCVVFINLPIKMNGTGSQYNAITAEENKGQLWVYNVVAFLKITSLPLLKKPLCAPHKPAFSDLDLEIIKMTNLVSSTWLTFFFCNFFFRLAAGSLWTQTYPAAAALSPWKLKYCKSGSIRWLDPGRQEKVMTPLQQQSKEKNKQYSWIY